MRDMVQYKVVESFSVSRTFKVVMPVNLFAEITIIFFGLNYLINMLVTCKYFT